jgi:hypothetical protein
MKAFPMKFLSRAFVVLRSLLCVSFLAAGAAHAADQAKDKGKGWVEGYKFLNPVSQKIEGKAMDLEHVGNTLVGCGIYKG